MLALLIKGIVLGLTAGVLPGPMLGLVVRETLQHGRQAGRLVAAAPLLTDAPIILLALLVVGTLPGWAVQVLSSVGGGFVVWMGVDALRTSTNIAVSTSSRLGSLRRAMITNWVNPHPWLFWLPVGGPLLVAGYRSTGVLGVALFLGGFYVMLVGSKVVLAEVVFHSSRFLSGPVYRRVIQASGLLLIGLGCLLLLEAF